MKNSVEYIQNLDLEYLALRVVRKLDWDLSTAQESVRKYKNFLILKWMYPESILVPTNEIDEIWHAHILHTKNYLNDCTQIFGKFAHHLPSSGTEDERLLMDDMYTKTMRLYETTFHESYGHALDIAGWQ